MALQYNFEMIPKLRQEALNNDSRYLLLYGSAGSGKCLRDGTKVLMYDMSHRNIETLELGEELMGADGTPRKVIDKEHGFAPLVHISDIKSQLVNFYATHNHKLCVFNLDTKQYSVTTVEFILKQKVKDKRRYCAYKQPIIFSEKKIPVDPYWLGAIAYMDLNYTPSFFNFTRSHKEIMETYKKCNIYGYDKSRFYIPKDILYNSIKVRQEFLCGIIEQNCPAKYVKQRIVFGLHKEVASINHDFENLCNSLGYWIYRTPIVSLKHEYWRTHNDVYMLVGDVFDLPFRNYNHLSYLYNKEQSYTRTLYLSELNNIEDKYTGIMVDKDHIFLLHNWIPTHNSYFTAQKIIYRCMIEKQHKFLIIRKTAPSLRVSCVDLMLSILRNMGLTYEWQRADFTIQIGNHSKIIFKGLDDPDKLKSIEGITSIWIEEAPELSYDDFQQLDLRLRGKTKNYKQMIFTFNPISTFSWIYKQFFLKEHASSKIIHCSYKDNSFLDLEYINKLEQLADEDKYFYTVYALGEWGRLDNLIFTNFKVDTWDKYHLIYDELIAGIDFGFNNPCCFLLIGIKDKVIYVIDEIYKAGIINKDFITFVNELLSRWYLNQGILKNRIICYADSAESDRIQEFRLNGFLIREANKDVLQGINSVKKHKIVIHSTVHNCIKEISTYRWRTDKNGMCLDIPVKEDDHCIIGDTIIDTTIGQYTIKELVGLEGLVYCYDTINKQITTERFYNVRLTNKLQEVYIITTISGKKIIATPEHLILTNHGFIPLENLSQLEAIVDISDNSISYDYIASIKFYGVYDVYNMEVENTNNYATNGLIIHNCMDALRYALHTHIKQQSGIKFHWVKIK